MARERKGTLIWRASSGWNAILTITKDGESIRKWEPLGTENKAAAKRKLARLVARTQRVAAVAHDAFEIVATWRLCRMEADCALVEREDSIEPDDVQMGIQVETSTESLNAGDGTSFRARNA
jgi:predicted secreted protein